MVTVLFEQIDLETGAFAIILLTLLALAVLAWHLDGARVSSSLESAVQSLESVSARIDDLLARKSYARDSQMRCLVTDATVALESSRTIGWLLHASSDQRRLVKVVTAFVAGSVELVASANHEFVMSELAAHAAFFDSVESKPLTDSQRRACVVNEDNNLVLAGAGTGKTSTMIGRAGYLLASQRAVPDELLMLAFARKAASEMQERLDERLDERLGLVDESPTVKTFHALGLEIIGKAEGRRPDLHKMAEDAHAFEKFIDKQISACCDDPDYRAMIIRYCGSEKFSYRNHFNFTSMRDYLEYVRTNELRTLKGEVVKSFEECVIANFLHAHGIAYKYEHPYEFDTSGPVYRQYKPDFYLPECGVYIEHFALDRSGNPPTHFDQKRYLEGVEWKRKTHSKNDTKLVETYSYLKRDGLLESHLTKRLKAAGIDLVRRSDDELLRELRDSGEVSEFAVLPREFLPMFKESGYSLDELRDKAVRDIDSSRHGLLLALFAPILDAYQIELSRSCQIDFADMIRKASDHVESGSFPSPYTHVLVDEFQDISSARARLLRAIVGQKRDAVLFAVGDDWQSIYRFTGSDIAYTHDFPNYFGPTATTPLEKTFRFNSKIGDVSSTFVLRNPAQIRKSIESDVVVEPPAVSLIRIVRDEDGLNLALNAIVGRVSYGSERSTHVLVLGRYNFTVKEWGTPAARRQFKKLYPSLTIDFMTVHAAKGKEADYVVVLGLGRGKHGFPCEKPMDSIIEWLLPAPESYPLAEERRLFYVALTRARHRVYLVYNPMEASSFIGELLDEDSSYPVCTDEIAAELMCADIPHIACPVCGSGVLVPRSGQYGVFVGCSNYPYCRYSEKPCPQCGGLMRIDGQSRTCTNPACGTSVPICPKCGGSMVERVGPYGRFWGCSNYRQGADFVCTHTVNIERHDASS